MRDIDDAQAVGSCGEQVAELQGGGAHVLKRNHGKQARLERLIEIQHHDARSGGDVGGGAAQRDMPCAVENAAIVPGQRARQEIIARLAVAERLDVGEDPRPSSASVINA